MAVAVAVEAVEAVVVGVQVSHTLKSPRSWLRERFGDGAEDTEDAVVDTEASSAITALALRGRYPLRRIKKIEKTEGQRALLRTSS